MSKKKKNLDELLKEVLIPEDEHPYKIPQNWICTRLGVIGAYHNGKAFKSKDWQTSGRPIVRIQDLTGTNKGSMNYFNGEVESKHEITTGDFLISWAATLGAFIWEGEDAVLNQHIFKVDSYIDKKFHFYLVSNLINSLYSKTQGSGMVHITKSSFDNTPVILPPLKEQKRIVNKIEVLFAKLDEAKQLIEEAKATLNIQINAVLERAFKGDLTAEWRKGNNSISTREDLVAELATERIQLCKTKKDKEYYTEQFQSLLIEKMTNIPDSWVTVTFELICHSITKGTTPKTSNITLVGDIPFLKVYNIVENKIDFDYKPGFIPKTVHENNLKRSIVYPGDVLMNIVGPPLGKLAIVPHTYPEWNINQAIAIFRPIKGVLNEFIYYSLLYEKTLEDVFQGTRGVVGQSNISLEQCRKLSLALPPFEEQIKTVEIIKSTFGKLKKVEENINSVSEMFEKTVQSILSKAFKGELVTNDSTDEPALELLKSILQEKL